MHRQSSRNTNNIDAIDCIVSTNDLILEDELINQEHKQPRSSSNSRRDQTSKNSIHRSTRHSPPSVTRKRHTSPPSILTSRSHHHYYSSEKHHHISSSPPSSSSQSSSRHHRSSRPVISVKRSHSHSRSPHERRPPIHRSRPELSTDRTINDVLTSTEERTISKKIAPKQEIGDLSVISEDESTKTHHIRTNNTTINESSSLTTNNKLHSTPSIPLLQPNLNENLLEMSNISQDYDLSLFAKSAILTTNNTSSILSTPINSKNDFIQTIDLISKYKMMQTIPYNNPQVEACSKEILILIQKQIELQKIELDCREREIKLREREIVEREKRFNEKSTDTISTISVHSEPLIEIKSTIIEEKLQQKSEQDTKNVSQEESVTKSISSTIDTSKVNLSNKNDSNQPFITRKHGGKSRFSQIIVDPSIFSTQQKPVVDLYSDDLDDNQSSLFINTNNSLKKTTISKILAPNESTISTVDTDLKVTSSNSCRTVEFQSGNIDKTTSKRSSNDLRLTLSKNRTKQQTNDDHDTNGNQSNNNNDQQPITISSKINSNKEDKQQSLDYQQQRSITSTSIETIIDDTNDKRDDHRHQQQRTNNSRQQQYSSSSTTNSNERSYSYGSTLQQQSKYGSNSKRHESDDLRSRLFEHKHPKSSRPTHRNNY